MGKLSEKDRGIVRLSKGLDVLISIIVPVYNAEKYIEKCVGSLIKQTYEKIEIILIDDGSKDNSYKICKEMQSRDSRIISLSKSNGGASSARNRGLKEAKGEYIAFVDADDYVEKDYVQIMYEAIEKNGSDIAICKPIKQYDDGATIEEKKYPNIHWCDGSGLLKFLRLEFDINWGAVWNKLFRTKIIKKYKLRYDERIKYGEDFLFVGSYLAYSYSGCIIDKVGYHYVYVGNSVSNMYGTNKGFDPEIISWLKSAEKLKKYCDSEELESAYNSYISYRCQDVLYILSLTKHKDDNLENKLVKKIKINKKFWIKSKMLSYKLKILMLVACYSLQLYKKICRITGGKNG
jgi:N-acetyllactosaminide beta-1,6-N-acetylglucosaminyl-transferase